MTNGTDADFLQVLLGEAREDPLVDLVVAECCLVFFEAQAPQPDHNVHDGAYYRGWRASWSCPEGVSSRGTMQPNILSRLGARRPAGSTPRSAERARRWRVAVCGPDVGSHAS
jgi:hypothetical protein